MSEQVVVIGGGGHAAVLVDALTLVGGVTFAGYVAPVPGRASLSSLVHLGDDNVRHELVARGLHVAVLGVGGASSNALRRRIYELWSDAGFTFVNVVHPRATISAGASYGSGLQALAGAVVNIGSRLGANVIINTNATVEHDCDIADHVHVAPAATLCAGVSVGTASFIGAGAVVIPGVRIGRDALIGAGSTVVAHVEDGERVAGSPARPISAVARI